VLVGVSRSGMKITNPSALRESPGQEADIVLVDETGAKPTEAAAAAATFGVTVPASSSAADDEDEEEEEVDEAEAKRRYEEQYGLHDADADEEGDEDGELVTLDDADDMDEALEVEVEDDSMQGFFLHRQPEKENAVFCIALSPADENIAISGDQVDRAFLWNTQTGEKLFELTGHTDSVISVAFSADGKLVATGSMDATVRVWRVQTGQLVHVLEGPAAEIEWVRFHNKGPIVLAGSTDGTSWMWNAEAAACMQVFAGHMGPVLSGLFSADGAYSIDSALVYFFPSQ
jgi:WD40 repeat protein